MNLYETCEKLFADYPLAADPVAVNEVGGTDVQMALMLQDGGEETFWLLYRDNDQPSPFFEVCPWRDPAQGVVVEPDGKIKEQGSLGPEKAGRVVTCSVPFPADGSMFGWKNGDTVTALVLFYAAPERDEEPAWSVMPLAGTPELQWPPFTGQRLLGPWFWEHSQAGRVVNLGSLIAQTQQMAFWAEADIPGAGAGCIAVKADLTSEDGFTLPRGLYVYSEALQSGELLPPLDELLVGEGRTDLGPRF